MIILDTNVLVRLFAGDDAGQMARAVNLIESAGQRKEPLLVLDLVFAETLWVLSTATRLPKEKVVQAAEALLGDGRFAFEHRERLVEAAGLYSEQKVDFTEAYATASAFELNARGLASFDHDLKKLPVKWIEP
jgi:predicted nucleic-acid-binding protein